MSAAGGTGTVAVATTAGCAWTSLANVPWISIAAGASGDGSGSVGYVVTANAGAARTGTMTIAGKTFTVTQAALECTFQLSSTAVSIAAAGGTSSVMVSTQGGCTWTAATNASWLHVSAGASGSGDGTVTFSADANTAESMRTGTLTVAGRTVTVSQAAAEPAPTCTFTLAPVSQTAAAAQGSVAVAVTASASSCAWTASSGAAWLAVDRTSGTGSGSVTVSWTANTDASPRSGIVTIAGKTFIVDQAAPACTFSISPTSQSIPDSGGSGPVAVTASAATCGWTAVSGASWITLDRASGVGGGTVGVTVAANTGGVRVGTVTIAGQTLTVTQAAAPPTCAFTISPTSQTVSDAGATGSFAITASAATCTWTATTSASWITLGQSASGTGSGTVGFTVAANTSSARTGTITAGGQVFTVSQQAAPPPCTFTISPPSATIDARGGNGSIGVNASGATCSWAAVSNAPWITLSSGQSGRGDGTVRYAVAANSGGQRSGTITVAGREFTVTQKKD